MGGSPAVIAGIKCFTGSRNTGKAACPYMPKITKGHIVVPFDFKVSVPVTATDKEVHDAVLAAIAAAMINDDPTKRAGFFGKYTGFEDKSEAPNVETKSYGGKAYTNDGTYTHDYMYTNGGQAYHNAVIKYRNMEDTYKVIGIEDTDKLRTVRQPGAVGFYDIFGMELENLYPHPFKAPTYQAEAEFRLSLTYATTSELNEDSYVIKSDRNLLSMIEKLAVIDLEVFAGAGLGGGRFPMTVKTVSGGVNVAGTFGIVLEDPSAWSFKNEDTGDAVDVLAVELNTVTGVYVVGLDSMSPGYDVGVNAVGGLALISDLEALGLEYFEGSNTVSVEMD